MDKIINLLKNVWKKATLALFVALLTVTGIVKACSNNVEDVVKDAASVQTLHGDGGAADAAKQPDAQ
jgi:membrane-anchored glycerophosphoryl diester phosphodiesterase (GDPDase)